MLIHIILRKCNSNRYGDYIYCCEINQYGKVYHDLYT